MHNHAQQSNSLDNHCQNFTYKFCAANRLSHCHNNVGRESQSYRKYGERCVDHRSWEAGVASFYGYAGSAFVVSFQRSGSHSERSQSGAEGRFGKQLGEIELRIDVMPPAG